MTFSNNKEQFKITTKNAKSLESRIENPSLSKLMDSSFEEY